MEVCDRALLLNRGRIAAYSDPKTVVAEYESTMHPDQKPRLPQSEEPVLGEKIIITAMHLSSDVSFQCGDALTIELDYDCKIPLADPIFSIRIMHESGAVCFDSNTQSSDFHHNLSIGKGRIRLHINRLDLNGGKYFLSTGVHAQNWERLLEYQNKLKELVVEPTRVVEGLLHPPCSWEMKVEAP